MFEGCVRHSQSLEQLDRVLVAGVTLAQADAGAGMD